jgi:hypothetical protein
MLDYRAWAERAKKFTASLKSLPGRITVQAEVQPALSESEVLAISSRLRLPLPQPICAFLTTASANCSCEYWWKPPEELQARLEALFPIKTFIFGGASLCDSSQFEVNERGCRDTAEVLEQVYPEDARLWFNAVPFHECGNGDYIGLYVGDDRRGDEFPVVYLNHDGYGGSMALAPSFDEFLVAWEELDYVHGSFLTQFFLDPIAGCINPRSPKKSALDDLLRAHDA